MQLGSLFHALVAGWFVQRLEEKCLKAHQVAMQIHTMQEIQTNSNETNIMLFSNLTSRIRIHLKTMLGLVRSRIKQPNSCKLNFKPNHMLFIALAY